MAKERYTPEEMAEALRQARGIQVVAARALRCERSTVRRYITRHRVVREAYEEARDIFVDEAEVQLMDAVDDGEWPAVRFALVTLGKERGYVVGGADQPDVENDEAIDEFEKALLRAYGGPEGGEPGAETVDDGWETAEEGS